MCVFCYLSEFVVNVTRKYRLVCLINDYTGATVVMDEFSSDYTLRI